MHVMNDALILTAVIVFVTAAFMWPTLRIWRRHGVWPIVFSREAAPAQRLLGWLTRALLFAIIGASLGRVVLGADRLGVWSAPAALLAVGWLERRCLNEPAMRGPEPPRDPDR